MALSWGDPVSIGDGDPRFPYTHWWLDQLTAISDTEPSTIEARLEQLSKQHFGLDELAPGQTRGDPDVEDPSPTTREDLIRQNVRFSSAANLFLDPDGVVERGAVNTVMAFETTPIDAGLESGDAIVAVIDDGAFFAHQRLWRDARRTRVAWAWLQGAPAPDGDDQLGNDLPFGREFYRDDIDQLLSDFSHPGGVDEDALYRAAGLIDLLRQQPQSAALNSSHGMAVMDLLAGSEIGDLAAVRLHPLWVSLPPRVTHDTSGSFIALFVMWAFEAVLNRARRMIEATQSRLRSSFQIPVVVNLSYGLTAGPKDGSGLLERFLSDRISKWRAEHGDASLSVFAPMGNHRLTRTHARLEAPGSGTDLSWRLLPDDPSPSFLEIWGAKREARPERPTLRPSLSTPQRRLDLPAPAPPDFDQFVDLSLDEGLPPAARAYFFWVPTELDQPHGPGREHVALVVQPTRPEEPGGPFVRPGNWPVSVLSDGDDQSWPVDVYVQRDDALPGYRRRGRQTRLGDSTYRTVDDRGRVIAADPPSPGTIRRAGTYNALASGPEVTLVAGVREIGGELTSSKLLDAEFSGLGFADAVDGLRASADTSATAAGPHTSPGLSAAGAKSGSRIKVRGTSFASPAAARLHALQALGLT